MRVVPRPHGRVLSAVVASALLGLVLSASVGASASAAATKTGLVRLAHLSPDTPSVDVYLDSLSSKQAEQVFRGVGYGTVSGYLTLPEGSYSVGMRLAGAAPNTPVVITTNVTVVAGHAYTVAGVGKHADLGLRVISDDLSLPQGTKAKVRIVQASINAPLIDVSLSNGDVVADNVAFATTTAYQTVTAGSWTLNVKPSGGGTTTPLKITLSPDSVYSLLVIDGKTALKADLLTDKVRQGAVPGGGVDAGAGGTAPQGGLPVPVLVGSLIALVAVVVGGTMLLRRPAADQWVPRRLLGRRRTTDRTL